MVQLTKTTELEAVNIMLSAIGEAPVSSLENTQLEDVAVAQNILNETIVDVQSTGYNFNTEYNFKINPDIDGNTLDKISTGKKSDKFGISFKILPEVCQVISEKKFINLVGISCHIGSQIQDLNIYEKVFLKMKEATKITENLGMIVKNLNLGGGFPSVYQKEKNIDFSKLSNLLNKIFMDSNFKISFEPGRSLVATSGLLVTKILTSKVNDSRNFLIVDAGMQTFLRPALYNSFHNIISLNQEGSLKKYTVGGPICESSDILAKDIELPSQQSGNFLAICDVGAYGSVMASNYNSRNLPAEILIHADKFSIIRNLENFSSVIDRDIIPDWLLS